MSYLEKNKEEIDKLIDEVLDEKVNIDFNGKSEDFINHFFNREEAERIILEREGTDIQKEFREAIKKNPMAIENINQSLSGKTRGEIEEEERQEQIDEKTEEIAKDENLTNEEKENIKEEAKDEKELSTEMLKALVVKAIYEHTLDEYHKLREDLYTGQNGQVKTGDLTNGDKMDTKLIMYQRYIRKLDLQYKGYTGYLITQDDEEIKEKENKYFKREQQNEKAVYEKTEDNLDRVQKLNAELNTISEDISRISANASLMTTEDFESQMSYLQQQYEEKNLELRALDPNLVELTRQVYEKERNDLTREKLVGQSYEDLKYKKGVIDSKNASLDEFTDNQEDRIDEKVVAENKDINDEMIQSIEEQQNLAESAFAKFEKTENIEDYNEAMAHLKMAEQMAGITSSNIEDEFSENESIIQEPEETVKATTQEQEDNEVKQQYDMGLTRTDNEKISILKSNFNERSRRLNENLNEIRSKQKDIDKDVMIRKMN